jgi:hypothetical protein
MNMATQVVLRACLSAVSTVRNVYLSLPRHSCGEVDCYTWAPCGAVSACASRDGARSFTTRSFSELTGHSKVVNSVLLGIKLGEGKCERGYKVITQHLVGIPQRITMHQRARQQRADGLANINAANSVLRAVHEARMQEAWKRHRFFVKPKDARRQRIWQGVIKRKRRDFNYRLRWALKSMTRCLPALTCWPFSDRL